jgi:hypothetical protein
MNEMEKFRALFGVALGLAVTLGLWFLGLWAGSGFNLH